MSDVIEKSASRTDAAASVERPEYEGRRSFGQLLRGDLGFLPVLLTLIVVVIYFTITTGGLFLKPSNLTDLLQQIVNIGIDGLGVTMVLLLGEVDLSIAAVGTFGAVITGVLSTRMGFNPYASMAVGVLAGALAGLINGIFIAVLRVPSFIVTLAGSIFYAGLLLYLLAGQSTLIVHDPAIVAIAGTPYSFLPDWLGVGLPTLVLICYTIWQIVEQLSRKNKGLRTKSTLRLVANIVIPFVIVEGIITIMENTPGPVRGTYLGIPNNVAIFFGLLIIVWLVMTKTTFGRHVYAVGGNMEAARRAGINVVATRLIVFTLCSAFAAIGGILQVSRATAVASAISPTLTLQAIAAAVIGGVSLFGGRGSVWAVALGALIIGGLENGLDLRSQGTDIKQMVEGAVLVLAVTADALVRRAQSRSSSGR
ncbi:sugar ABC transporter permease [Ktedonospora formicarum]|uniref:Xylose transport system permease protein XylH n=1 Tax=Ktedonospora formicarum TaxID=2778364 RepID=A0A8J3I3N3_9CHLR|nr:inner-membrane translocator [Ktedonospora formicarum]GHO45592.1 ABC transporter permease [Ktedonospora formicarum]